LAHIFRDQRKILNRVRRIRGQIECRGAIDSLMAEVFDGHIRFHVADPNEDPASERARATQELIDVIKAYLR
jgi:DNA-binding FrmR family transcriptional regulator